MDSLKQYRKAIDLAVYGVALLCTLLFAVYSVWGFGISGFTILFEASFIGGLLLILAPVMGIVLELVLAKNMDERTQMIVNLVICIAGVLLLFIAKALLWSVWDSVAFSPSSPIWPAVSSMACSCLAETWDPPLPAVRSAPTAASPWHLERPSAPTVARS